MQSHLKSNEEQLRREQQRVTELQGQRRGEQEIIALRQRLIEKQQQETGRYFSDHQPYIPRDWVIKETEIQMTTEELGRGAWGAVFKGKFRGCDVAVKEMFEQIYSSYNRHLFEREVDIASKCRHPCLLQFIGATVSERLLSVTEIMDFSLRARLSNSREPPLSERQICVF